MEINSRNFWIRWLIFWNKDDKIPTTIQLTEVELTTGSIVNQESTVWARKVRQLWLLFFTTLTGKSAGVKCKFETHVLKQVNHFETKERE